MYRGAPEAALPRSLIYDATADHEDSREGARATVYRPTSL
jgi:hypothetical protein